MLHNNTRRRRTTNSEGSWAVSYVDMLTLLLCFFIIFYNTNVESVNEKSTPLEKIVFELSSAKMTGEGVGLAKGEAGRGTGNGEGPGVGSGAGTDAGSGIKRMENGAAITPTGNATLTDEEYKFLDLIRGKMTGESNVNSRITQKSLQVEFEGVSFFDSGQTKLVKTAEELMVRVAKVLEPHKDSIRVVVQGHTDSRQVHNKKINLTDNWELSVIRATSVLRLFMKEGFPQELLSAEGFADTKIQKRELASDKEEDLAFQRRITLRIEPRINK